MHSLNRAFVYTLLLSLLSVCVSADLFSSHKALPAHEAIQYELEQNNEHIRIHFTLADNVYLYKEKLKLSRADKSKLNSGAFIEDAQTIEDPSFGEVPVFFERATFQLERNTLKPEAHTLSLKYQGCDQAIGLCYPPQKATLNINKAGTSNTTQTKAENLNSASGIEGFLNDAGTLLIIGTFLLLGIGLTFTPCVLPMVPILSSIIAGQKSLTPSKGFALSSFYVLGMAITFALAGVLVGSMGARFNLQIYMQQPWVLSLFAGLFVLLALAMFGLYELRLPQFIQGPLDRLNQKQSGGSFIGVFFMGALSAVVVSPCVSAPLAGALVYISTTGDALLGGLALFALGLGMGLPLIAIGTTGASVLPKAGSWMEQVKVFFGVLLLAVAIWLLGRFIPESIYMLAWAVLIGVYCTVLGAFNTANSNIEKAIKGLSLMGFAFALMLIFKVLMADTSLTTISSQTNTNNSAAPTLDSGFFQTVKNKDAFEKLLNNAKKNEQLVFIDVYADWCIECKIMGKEIFEKPDVQAALSNFVNIKLDITEFSDFHKSYLEEQGIFGPPALLFYGINGESIKEAFLLGEVSKSEFLNHLEQFDH